MFIQPFRSTVTEMLKTRCSVPVYGWLPDDVAHVPVLVVGRPSIRESRTPGISTLTLTVNLLGRRISDEDSQAELDALADQLFIVLGGTKNVKRNDLTMRCTQFLPGTVIVAGQEMPAYLADVAIEAVSCD